MGNDVFANGREIACKEADGKSICAFPDVCMTPPENPATPPGVPVPYPNTGLAKDTTSGSRSVKISGKEVMLKNKSYFKKSMGDEAGAAAKKGVVTSVNRGKVYFTAWSMDVKCEGENVVRHLDLTTHNHACEPGQTPSWPFMDAMAVDKDPCKDEKQAEESACAGKTQEECCSDSACQSARKCKLTRYGGEGSPNCCRPQVAHHLIPNSLLQEERGDSSTNVAGLKKNGKRAYTLNGAPCVCCDGEDSVCTPIGTHKRMHDNTKAELQAILLERDINLNDAKNAAASAHNQTFLKDDATPVCTRKCLEAQIDRHMKDVGTGGRISIRQKDGATRKNYEKRRIGKV